MYCKSWKVLNINLNKYLLKSDLNNGNAPVNIEFVGIFELLRVRHTNFLQS